MNSLIEMKHMELTGSTDSGAEIPSGLIVKYKGVYCIIVGSEYARVQIMRPHMGNTKLWVSICNVERSYKGCVQEVRTEDGKWYWLTKKGYIVSQQSKRLINCPRIRKAVEESDHKCMGNLY